jgi:hypothetical protein
MVVGLASLSFPSYYGYRWRAADGLQPLPVTNTLSTYDTQANGVSADGLRVAGNEFQGSSGSNATFWMASLPDWSDASEGVLPGGAYYVVDGISSDGRVIVGSSAIAQTQGATVWTSDPSRTTYTRRDLINDPGGQINDQGCAASVFGGVVVGSRASGGNESAWYWTEAGGTMALTGMSTFATSARAVDDAGGRIVGYAYDGGFSDYYRALVWDGVAAAPRLLDEILASDYGMDLGTGHLLKATSISSGGTTIVGVGKQTDAAFTPYYAFRVRLNPTAGVGAKASATSFGVRCRSNPARGRLDLTVTLADDSPASLELMDITGRLVLQRVLRQSGAREQTESVPLAGLPGGLYFVRLAQGDRRASARVVTLR